MEITEKFAQVPLFEGLDHREIQELLAIAEEIEVDSGEEVCRQGTPGDGFYVIAAGEFEVLKSGDKNVVLARLGNFSYFGEMSLVSRETRVASVICTQKGRLRKFPIDAFNDLLDEGNLTAYRVIRNMCGILAKRLQRSDDRFVS